MLDKDTSLVEKIRTLFREQGITIASILMAIRMAIGVLIEALLPGGGGTVASPPPPKDEKGLKEWIRNKLKALASLLGKLGVKAAEALPGIIGAIISWIRNRMKEVVGWLPQNLWAQVLEDRSIYISSSRHFSNWDLFSDIYMYLYTWLLKSNYITHCNII